MTSKFKLYESIVLDNIKFTVINISVIPQCAQYIDNKFVYLFDFNYSLSYGDYKIELTETEINNLINLESLDISGNILSDLPLGLSNLSKLIRP